MIGFTAATAGYKTGNYSVRNFVFEHGDVKPDGSSCYWGRASAGPSSSWWLPAEPPSRIHSPYWADGPVVEELSAFSDVTLGVSIPLYVIFVFAAIAVIIIFVQLYRQPLETLPRPQLAAPLAIPVPFNDIQIAPTATSAASDVPPQPQRQFMLPADNIGSFSDEDQFPCLICYNRPVATTLVPCGHRVACEQCAQYLQLNDPCNLCRAPIGQIVHDTQVDSADPQEQPPPNSEEMIEMNQAAFAYGDPHMT